jgi:carboxylate-amine ligase
MLRSYDEYEAAVSEEITAAEVPEYTFVCWEVRPHPRFGTLEVRVMDAQPSLRHASGLVALVQGLARHAVENPPGIDMPTAVLAANDFRALRYGLDTPIVDVDGRMRPMRAVAAEAIALARSALAEKSDDPLNALDDYLHGEPEYQRQRRIHNEHGMRGLLRDLVGRTAGDAPRTAHARRRSAV